MEPIPSDKNGEILRRMLAGGDTLAEPRNIDFFFLFPERNQALRFAGLALEKEYEVCLSFYEEREMWEAVVKRYMTPEHSEITRIENVLSERAITAGGAPDGWGCIRITTT